MKFRIRQETCLRSNSKYRVELGSKPKCNSSISAHSCPQSCLTKRNAFTSHFMGQLSLEKPIQESQAGMVEGLSPDLEIHVSPEVIFFENDLYTHPHSHSYSCKHTCTHSHVPFAPHKPSYCFLKVEKLSWLSWKHFSPKYWLPVLLPDETVHFPRTEVWTIGTGLASFRLSF